MKKKQGQNDDAECTIVAIIGFFIGCLGAALKAVFSGVNKA